MMRDAVAGRPARARPAHLALAADPDAGEWHDSRPRDAEYLRDYATLMSSVAHPSVLFDHRWDVVLTNPAYDALFTDIRSHPTAMPHDNILRFVLFHPDADTVLAERETSWCLPLMARLASRLETHGQDRGLQAIRRDIADDPIMDAAYRLGLPHWIRAVGPEGVSFDGSVRPLQHRDPGWGPTWCRLLDETSRGLRDMGYTRITFVPRAPDADATGEAGPRHEPRPRSAAVTPLQVAPLRVVPGR